MTISDILIREAIITELNATTKEGAFRELVSSVQDAGHLADVDPEELVHALQWREELNSQAPGRGIFCPEGGHSGVDRVVGTIALSRRALDFGATDGRHVDVIFLLLGPRIIDGAPIQPGDQHLWFGWQALVPVIVNDNVLDRLRECRTREEVFDLVVAADQETPHTVKTGSS
jgi:mannitol/fructose-specific phosphotransferase system IIA component (Ntr-type)